MFVRLASKFFPNLVITAWCMMYNSLNNFGKFLFHYVQRPRTTLTPEPVFFFQFTVSNSRIKRLRTFLLLCSLSIFSCFDFIFIYTVVFTFLLYERFFCVEVLLNLLVWMYNGNQDEFSDNVVQ